MVSNIGAVGLNNINFRALETKKTQNEETKLVTNPLKENIVQKNIVKNDNYVNSWEIYQYNNDFNIKAPQHFKKEKIYNLPNNLSLYTYKLANGLKVSIVPMKNSPVVVKNYVNVGSLNENDSIKGISHFLEHMAFNGTKGENGYVELKVGDSFKEIEKLGGSVNASTSHAVTDYFNITPAFDTDDIETQIKVMAAMTDDLKLSTEMIEKEKGPVISEINMILEQPETIAMDQTIRTLYNIESSSDEMIGGSVEHIRNLTRKDVKDYYEKYYTPDNMNLVITGDVNPDDIIRIVAKEFKSKKVSKGEKFNEPLKLIDKSVRKDLVTDKSNESHIIFGFEGPKYTNSKELITLELAKAYINLKSSKLHKRLDDLNSNFYIDFAKVSNNKNQPGMITLSSECPEKNIESVIKTITSTIKNLQKPNLDTLEVLKERLIFNKNNNYQYAEDINSDIGHAVLVDNIDYVANYEKILSEINSDDVKKCIDKYFNFDKTALTVMHSANSKNINFTGKRDLRPIDESNVDIQTLDNNFQLGLYKINSNNCSYIVDLELNRPYKGNSAAPIVLGELLSKETKRLNEEVLNKFKEKNNIRLYIRTAPTGIEVQTVSLAKNKEKSFNLLNEVLYNPNFSQENFDKIKEKLCYEIKKSKTTSADLYTDYISQIDNTYVTKEKMLKDLDALTVEKVRDFYNHVIANAAGNIVVNIPEKNSNEFKEYVVDKFANLPSVKNKNFVNDVYRPHTKAKVLTKSNNNIQADITMVNRFRINDTLEENIKLEVINSILSSMLFQDLRERQHLAYSVYSNIAKYGNTAEIHLKILTTTDNIETGEQSYKNVQQSIDGFKNNISIIKDGNFSNEIFENAKKILKANLLSQESDNSKLYTLLSGMNSKYGIFYKNEAYNYLDKLTKQEIIEFAEKAFANPPIYSVLATKNTLDNNLEYFKSLKNDYI